MKKINSNKKLSSSFIKKLAEFSAGYLENSTFEKLINLFEHEISGKYFTGSSEANLLRIILNTYDKISFLNDCLIYPHYAEILVNISVYSNYLTDILVRNPEYFYWIVNPSTLKTKYNLDDFKEEVASAVKPFKSFNAKTNALRSLKRKHILKIGIMDIFEKTDLEEITNSLSIIANGISSILFELCYLSIKNKYEIKKIKNSYSVISLGKLGGNELNYSSDIDLIILYDEDSELINGFKYSEFLNEVILLFIESISSITSSGFIYRVDFRLRPFGKNSLLTGSITEYLNYYESFGEDWERQMLIKMNCLCGDLNLYKKFKKYLNPFIYPSSFSTSPTEQIKKLKNNIERKLKSDGNIKLASGGIRDIEFSVQALQLLNGGRINEIKTPNTIDAVKKLQRHKLLSDKETDVFIKAYDLYRKTEHFLQLMNDTQTHSIPGQGETLEKLSSFLGYKTSSDFQNQVNKYRNEVSKVFQEITGTKKESHKDKIEIQNINFQNYQKAVKNLEFLREGKGILEQKQFDKRSINEFIKIEEALFEYLKKSGDPDLVLQNFVRFIRLVEFPSIWYQEFSNKKYFHSFLKLCEYSQYTIDLFAEDDELREYLLSKKVFEKLNKNKISFFSLKKLLFVLSIQFILELIEHSKVSYLLSEFIKNKIELISNIYLPSVKINYFIAALGSFSINEMTFYSDVDLIFAVNKIDTNKDIQKEFQSLLLKLKDELKPIQVDCRLRPEGKSSYLAWELNSYKKYFLERARIWEIQSYSKINFICGDKKAYNSLMKSFSERIKTENNIKIKAEFISMRKKLYPHDLSAIGKSFNVKKSIGGLNDIEFILQYLIIKNQAIFNKCRGKETGKIINKLIKFNSEFNNLKALINYFDFMKTLEISNQLIFNSSKKTIPINEEKKKLLSKKLGFENTGLFDSYLLDLTNKIHSTYKIYLGS